MPRRKTETAFKHWPQERREAGDQALAALREAERRLRACVYCGATVSERRQRLSPVTCTLHGDLPALDPHYLA